MKIRFALALALALGGAHHSCLARTEDPAETLNANSLATARDAVMPSVVSILVVREDFSGGEARLSLSGGTGTIVTAEGHIATNAHVAEKGKRFRIVLNDQREFPARLVGTDTLSDLAVLKIVAPDGTRFRYGQFAADISDLQPGDAVLAMGAPLGMRDSLSAGVINHSNRLMVSLFEDEADYEQSLGRDLATARYYAWIQHDASISPGNSGGPLVDLRGRIVGVNTRGNVFGGDMAFSIPAPIARKVVNTLIADGAVARSNYGFGVRSLRGTGFTEGALISGVDRDSLAEKAGLHAGDRLIALQGEPLTLAEPEAIPNFRRELAERPIGSEITLKVLRQGKPHEIRFASVAQDTKRAVEAEIPHWGMSVVPLTQEMARARYLDDTRGVLIQGLRTGGPAGNAQPSLLVGDRILKVNGEPVLDLASFSKLAGELDPKLESGEDVRLEVERRGQALLSLLTPQPKRVIATINPELAKSWAGWEVQPVPITLAGTLGLNDAGFRVTRIYADGPAAKAGIQVGDLITATGGVPVKPSGLKETSALDLRVRNGVLEEPFEVSVNRAGASKTIALKLTEQPLPVEKAERRWNERLSLTIRALTFYDRVERELSDNQKGVIVERVESGGYGGLAHVREGDLLVRLGDTAVDDLPGFEAALARAERERSPKLSFLVMRGIDTRLLFVDAPWREVK